MSKEFIEAPPFNLNSAFDDSNPYTPIIFILSTGADPLAEISKFASERGLTDNDTPKKSLGRGQEKVADQSILKARKEGQWIILQNCHMCPTFFPILENRIVETKKMQENMKKNKEEGKDDEEADAQEIDEENMVNDNFRFWITTMPTEEFPTYVMQNSIKLT
jgi:dynein heavy chain